MSWRLGGMYLSIAILLCSCTTAPLLTPDNFNAISVGSSFQQIEESYGSPYDVRTTSSGIKEYRYIQRIYVNENVTDQIEYIFFVQNGRVLDKQRRDIGSSANLQFNN